MVSAVFAVVLGLLAQALHMALMLVAAPVVVGLVRVVKGRLLGRRGPPLMQPWRDLMRLLRKQPVLADNASIVFRAAPWVTLAATAAAAALIPSFTSGMSLGPVSDLLVIAGLLALGRCATALAGMDIGTAFGGIGASREMTFSVYAEPALLLVIFTLAMLAGSTNLDVIASVLRDGNLGLRVSLGLALVAMLTVAIAENGRIPVDNPATHLELTMVHEAMVLEYSGRDLALVEAATALKLTVWLSLIGAIFCPFGMAEAGDPLFWPLGLMVWVVKIGALAIALALFETSLAKMRVFRVPEFLGVALLLGLLAAVFLFLSTGIA